MGHKNIRRAPLAVFVYTTVLTVLAGTFLPVASASAADSASGTYIGLGLGKFNEESELALESSKNNAAYKVYVGYQLGFIGVEGGYARFNDLRFNLGGTSAAHIEAYSYYARLGLSFPVLRTRTSTTALYVAGGTHRWSVTEVITTGSTTTGKGRAHDTEVMYGAGIHVQGQGNSALRFDYEVFKDIGTANLIDFKLLSANLLIYF